MHRMRPSRLLAVPTAWVVALVVVACQAGSPATPAPTAIVLPSLSLLPASETSTPEPAATPGEVPPIGPPSNVPPPPEVAVEYAGPPDDLTAFVTAYRSAFQVPELSDQQIADAGARLCTYLQRHATPNGAVDVDRALAEAEIHEPGYPRDAWQRAFQLASADYCGEFSFATEGQG